MIMPLYTGLYNKHENMHLLTCIKGKNDEKQVITCAVFLNLCSVGPSKVSENVLRVSSLEIAIVKKK